MAYIGSISYGMYMLHMLCKNAVVKLLGAVGIGSKGLEVFVLTLGGHSGRSRIEFQILRIGVLEVEDQLSALRNIFIYRSNMPWLGRRYCGIKVWST
jgi:hypothetical protein